MALVAVLLAAIAGALRGGERPAGRGARAPSPPSEPTRMEAVTAPSGGVLVYAATGPAGPVEWLWLYDPVNHTASRGPVVWGPRELVASRSGRGWLAVTSGRNDGLVLGGTGVNDRPVPLGGGTLLAWSPDGDTLATQARRPVLRGCSRSSYRTIEARTGVATPLFDGPDCSSLVSMGVDSAGRVFATRSREGRTGVYRVGPGAYRLVLDGFAMLGVAPSGVMLASPRPQVVPTEFALRGTPLMVWRRGGQPVEVRDRAGRTLQAERVLGWSRNGRRAAVLGTVGPIRSVWLVTVAPGGEQRAPVRAAPVLGDRRGPYRATFGPGGTLYEVIRGRLYRAYDGTFAPEQLPEGAPPIGGPIAWLDR